jgi:hypothetical protein
LKVKVKQGHRSPLCSANRTKAFADITGLRPSRMFMNEQKAFWFPWKFPLLGREARHRIRPRTSDRELRSLPYWLPAIDARMVLTR